MFLVALLLLTSNTFTQNGILDIAKTQYIHTIYLQSAHAIKIPTVYQTSFYRKFPPKNDKKKMYDFLEIYSYIKIKNTPVLYNATTKTYHYKIDQPQYIDPIKIQGIKKTHSRKLFFFEEEQFALGEIIINKGGVPGIAF